MELHDAIKLLQDKHMQHQPGSTWADLGCGSGLFSYALANILARESTVYAIDKQQTRLAKHENPRNILIKQQQLDFVTDDLGLESLDGILMANSLHFVKNKTALIHKLAKSLKTGAGFLIVEYDTDRSNPWVPFPVSFKSLQSLFEDTGFTQVAKIHEVPSAFGRSMIYGASVMR